MPKNTLWPFVQIRLELDVSFSIENAPAGREYPIIGDSDEDFELLPAEGQGGGLCLQQPTGSYRSGFSVLGGTFRWVLEAAPCEQALVRASCQSHLQTIPSLSSLASQLPAAHVCSASW